MMKRIAIAQMIFMLLCLEVAAQKKKIAELKINDPIPAGTKLGSVIDSYGNLKKDYQGKNQLSQFKGKLIILDFWQTYCHSCIEGFEEMSALQKKYNDRIQIFLVNPREDEAAIIKWIKKTNAKRDSGNPIVPANLPILGNAVHIEDLFPSRGPTGYHAWISPEGKVILRGIHDNTHEKKIEEALSGKKIEFMEDNALKYDKTKPFFIGAAKGKLTNRPVFTAFSRYDDKNADIYGVGTLPTVVFDSANNSKRITMLNYSAEMLYRFSLSDSTNKFLGSQFLHGDPFILDVPDISLVSVNPALTNDKLTDESMRKALYCYEQVVPMNGLANDMENLMVNSLNSYFDVQLNITGATVKREISVYTIFVQDSAKLRASTASSMTVNLLGTKPTRIARYEGGTITEIFKDYFAFQSTNPFGRDVFIVDGTDSKLRLDLELPSDPYNYDIKKFERVLNNKGIGLKQTSRLSTLFVVSSNGNAINFTKR